MREPKNDLKLELYNQGLTDRAIAERVGRTPQAIASWRCYHKLPSKNCVQKRRVYERTIEYIINCPMEDALSPDQCEVMRAFLGSLEQLKKDIRPGTKVNILKYAKAWGEKYFQNKTKEEAI